MNEEKKRLVIAGIKWTFNQPHSEKKLKNKKNLRQKQVALQLTGR